MNEIVHCLQGQADIESGRATHPKNGRIPRIQESPEDVRVVLFKTALSTGWDCPRAEVMMSFRQAQDQTLSMKTSWGRMILYAAEHDELGQMRYWIRSSYFCRILTPNRFKKRGRSVPHPDAEEGVPTRVKPQL